MKAHKTVIFSIFILIVCAVAFYFPVLFQGKMYMTQDWGRGDLTHFNYPLHHIYGNEIKKFSLPFWTDEVYGGFAMGAEGQVGMFYLPNIILFFLFSNYIAFGLSFFVVSLLATIGTYIFSRQIKLSNVASIFSAITFGYSMFFAAHFVHINMIQAFSLVPWFFVLVEWGIQKRFYWYIFLLFVLLQQQMFFTGHPQIALYVACGVLLYTYFRSPREKRIKHVLLLIVAMAIGTVISMMQLLPTWELSKVSPSTALESADNSITLFPYTLRDILYFFFPTPYGDPSTNTYKILLQDGIFWENNTFSGILAIIFFLVLAFKKQKYNLKTFYILCLIFFLFSMGWIFIFYYIPPFSLFRLPQRSLIILLFFFSVLSAFGFDYVLEKTKKYGGQAVITIAILLILFQFANLAYTANAYNNPIPKDAWLSLPKTAEFLKNKEGRIYAIGGVPLWEKVYTTISHGWAGKGGEYLAQTKAILDPNRNATYADIHSLEGYAKLVPLRTLAYLSLIRNGVQEKKDSISIATSSAQLLGLSSVKTVVTAKPVEGNVLKEVFSYTDKDIKTTFHVYENPFYLPEIRSAEKLLPLERKRKVLASDLLINDENWQHTVFGEEKIPAKNFSNSVSITKKYISPQHISFSVTSKDKVALIVVAQSFDSNWKAWVDKHPTTISPININSQGIIVPEGNHVVELSYVPKPFIQGVYIGLFGIVLLGASCIILYRYELV